MDKMVSVAMLYLLVLEPFLTKKLKENTVVTTSKQDRSLHIADREPKLTKFYLFTPKTNVDGRSLIFFNPESFENFNPALETKIIIHGFKDQVRIAVWMHTMKDEFLRYGNFNIIVVDWSSGNSIPYSAAAANTEKVGHEISDLLKFLINRLGGKPEKFHLIGHSLGAHVAGFVGEHIKPIGRITGLDPALYHFKDASLRKRLDRSDAIFVDIIHTDAGGIGMVKPIGHVDFYPNGGSSQPGCTATNYVTTLLRNGVVESVRSLICSHMRAVPLFIESINSKQCQMPASRCGSWKNYEDRLCGDCGVDNSKCAIFGYHVDPEKDYGNHSYYLMTADAAPFCLYEYRLKMIEVGEDMQHRMLLPSWSARDALSKKTYFVILKSDESEAEFVLKESNELSRNSYVVTSPKSLGKIEEAFITWKPLPVGVAGELLSSVLAYRQMEAPLITRIEVFPMNASPQFGVSKYILCSSPGSLDSKVSILTLRTAFC